MVGVDVVAAAHPEDRRRRSCAHGGIGRLGLARSDDGAATAPGGDRGAELVAGGGPSVVAPGDSTPPATALTVPIDEPEWALLLEMVDAVEWADGDTDALMLDPGAIDGVMFLMSADERRALAEPLEAELAARGEPPAAFNRRCAPRGPAVDPCRAQSQTAGLRGRAWPRATAPWGQRGLSAMRGVGHEPHGVRRL